VAAVVPLTEIVKLVNIGTLFAFVLVNIGVIILRRTRPDSSAASGPFVPVFPIVGALLCFLPDALPRSRDVVAVRGLAGARLRHLLLVWPATLAPAAGEVINPEAELPGPDGISRTEDRELALPLRTATAAGVVQAPVARPLAAVAVVLARRQRGVAVPDRAVDDDSRAVVEDL
jgi:amino acid transporter